MRLTLRRTSHGLGCSICLHGMRQRVATKQRATLELDPRTAASLARGRESVAVLVSDLHSLVDREWSILTAREIDPVADVQDAARVGRDWLRRELTGCLVGRLVVGRSAVLDAQALLYALVLDDGRSWGEAALDWQSAEAGAILGTDDPDAPGRHYALRCGELSKTTDVSAVVLVLLLSEALSLSRSYVYAVDHDQLTIFGEAPAGLTGVVGVVERCVALARR